MNPIISYNYIPPGFRLLDDTSREEFVNLGGIWWGYTSSRSVSTFWDSQGCTICYSLGTPIGTFSFVKTSLDSSCLVDLRSKHLVTPPIFVKALGSVMPRGRLASLRQQQRRKACGTWVGFAGKCVKCNFFWNIIPWKVSRSEDLEVFLGMFSWESWFLEMVSFRLRDSS